MPHITARSLRLLATLVALLVFVAPLFAQQDETVADFKKYFRTFKDTATRVEAVMALEGRESPEVVEALVPILKLEDVDVVRAAIKVLSKFKTDPPKLAIFATLEASKDEAVRSGLLRAMAAGKYTGANEALKTLLTDKSWELRRRAIEALASSGDATVGDAIAPLCGDSEPGVRSTAFDALALLKSPLLVQPAIAALSDEVWQVRLSAIQALRRVRSRDTIEPLVARMQVEEGRLQPEIGTTLGEITGRGYGPRTEQWQMWWQQVKAGFKIPTDEELAKLRDKQKAEMAKYKAGDKPTVYHGIETPSRRIMFVIDCSGSMENLVIEKERFQDGNYPSYLRIDIVKTELVRTIESLEGYVEFNIIAFATAVKPWKKELVKANVLNKTAAMDWARKLEAIGGASKEDLAQAGLVSSANLDGGKTNTFGALASALGYAGAGLKDKAYACAIDTIFFLSDGRPTVGEYVEPKDVLREVKNINTLRKVVIHTIAIGEFQKDFMKQLADENGGIFVDLGR